MIKQVFYIWVILASIQLISAQYITGDIYIDEQGKADFYIDSDFDLNLNGVNFFDNKLRGESDFLTIKNKDIWTFNLDFGNYETILLDIHFPKNLESINSVQGVESVINLEDKTISLIGENERLYFKVDYRLSDKKNYDFVYVFMAVLIIICILFFYFLKSRRKKISLKTIMPFINENEQKILEMLMKEPMRQKQVREKLGIPKASFTRYIVNLEKKKLIFREGEGKNKILRVR